LPPQQTPLASSPLEGAASVAAPDSLENLTTNGSHRPVVSGVPAARRRNTPPRQVSAF
jgi:hypothetical protein